MGQMEKSQNYCLGYRVQVVLVTSSHKAWRFREVGLLI